MFTATISHGRILHAWALASGLHPPIVELAYSTSVTLMHQASWGHVDEIRGYTEQLIHSGMLGNTNKQAMPFSRSQKDLIPKLFQVLAPQYQGQNGDYRECCRSQMGMSRIRPRWQRSGRKRIVSGRDKRLILLNRLLQGCDRTK